MERRNIEVPRAHAGEAVARILHDGLGVPHATAKGLIDAGCVTVNGRPATTHGQRCSGGDVVEVRFDPGRRYLPLPAPRHGSGFRVVHEDKEIVLVDKMPGVLSSPAPGQGEESLAEKIAESLRRRGIRRPQLFVVHRLDRHTSGLVVFARSQRGLESLSAQFESHEAGRIYSALVEGRIEKDRGTITSWLMEDPKSLSVRTTSLRGAGKRAVTHFEVVERFERATLVRVRLETGRKHQIRIHFAEIGHPVLGDRRYGTTSLFIQRVALHAERLTFRHPFTLRSATFESPWPDDFARVVQKLRKGGVAADDARPTARVAPFPPGLTLTEPAASRFEKTRPPARSGSPFKEGVLRGPSRAEGTPRSPSGATTGDRPARPSGRERHEGATGAGAGHRGSAAARRMPQWQMDHGDARSQLAKAGESKGMEPRRQSRTDESGRNRPARDSRNDAPGAQSRRPQLARERFVGPKSWIERERFTSRVTPSRGGERSIDRGALSHEQERSMGRGTVPHERERSMNPTRAHLERTPDTRVGRRGAQSEAERGTPSESTGGPERRSVRAPRERHEFDRGRGRRYEKPFVRNHKKKAGRTGSGVESSQVVSGTTGTPSSTTSTAKGSDERNRRFVPGRRPVHRALKDGEKKPWEFPQKGMKRKLERRRKIAAARTAAAKIAAERAQGKKR